ncbi:MAG TPA: hypothetical protein VFI31_20415 [Pirellulales bacterium]|nr:hypothetical protein [Pirellulales bacterium]
MEERNPSEPSAAGKPLPHCNAFLLCEEVTENNVTGAVCLMNLVEVVLLSEFPGSWGPFVLFLQLYDGIGRYGVRVELHDLTDDRVAKAGFYEVDFPNRLDKMDLAIPIEAMRLPRPGRYKWVVYLNDEELAMQYFDAEAENGKEEKG